LTLLATSLRKVTGRHAGDGRAAVPDMQTMFREHLQQLAALAQTLAESAAADAAEAIGLLAACLQRGGKILACGNGGSAADAQHFVAELVGRMLSDRPPLAAVSLTTDTSVLTAIANDYGFEEVFARQVEAIGRPGDALVVVSTSGRSPNIVAAVSAAVRSGLTVISLTGAGGDPTLNVSDVWFRTGSDDTPHIQELHTAILHTLCLGIEESIFASK